MTIAVNGITLYYEVQGQGQPLIMIHGNGEDHTIFAQAAAVLSEHFTCYLLDSRGHGQSTPVSTLSYATMAEDMIAFADALALKKPTLYGFSDGGIIGLMVAMRRPELLERLIVSGANLNPLGVKLKTYLELRIATIINKDPKLLLMVREPQIKPQALSAIRVPTLVLAGKGDLIREKHTRQITANIPNAELQLLEGEDHGSYIVHSTKIAELILGFCGKQG